MRHRHTLLALFGALLMVHNSSLAGAQQYEVLKDETRQLMSRSISDLAPQISSFVSEKEKQAWLSKHLARLQRHFNSPSAVEDFLLSVHYEALRAGLDPEMVLGLIEVESGFQKYALSSVGARGFMQVMPFWVDIIGQPHHNLFHLRTNLRYGCTVLRHYLEIEKGDIFRALGRYNGSLGQAKYPNAVLGATQKYR